MDQYHYVKCVRLDCCSG